MGGQEGGVLGGHLMFLTIDMEDMAIPDVMDDLILSQGRHPESSMLISLLEVCQEWGVKKGGTWRTLRVPDQRHGGKVNPDVINDVFFTLRKIP